MGWPNKKKERPSLRESLEAHQRAICFYKGVPYVENDLQKRLPPKREIRRPVDGKPVGPTEHQEQSAVISWWYRASPLYQLQPFTLFAIPNGGARDMITGARLKAEGVRPGIYDLMLAVARKEFHGLFIEMKVRDNQPSPKQKEVGAYLLSAGYQAIVCWSADSAIAEIKQYLGEPT